MAEPSDYNNQPGKSPRKELQGPRPTPLKINKGSHKIKKPPVVPQPSQPPVAAHHQQPPRQPVIIYTVSPKIIHTEASKFRDLVQRLTGLPTSSTNFGAGEMAVDPTTAAATATTTTSSTTSTITNNNYTNPSNFYGGHFMTMSGGGGGGLSPAARYAAVEKAKSPPGKVKGIHFNIGNNYNNNNNDHIHHQYYGMEIMDHDHHDQDYDHHEIVEKNNNNNNKGLFSSGILSPGPASLPPIHPNFFSPPSDSFFHDLSPVIHHHHHHQGSSNNNYFISPRMISSPNTPSIDFLLSNIFSSTDQNL